MSRLLVRLLSLLLDQRALGPQLPRHGRQLVAVAAQLRCAVACAVAFGMLGFAFVNPELCKKCGSPWHVRTEPVLMNMTGYRTLYSDTYKCLTQHGMVVHLQQVKWITDTKLGMFPDISQSATVKALECLMQATGPGVDLFARRLPADMPRAKATNPTYSAAVLLADPGKLYHADGMLRCRCQYVDNHVLQLDRLCVADTLKAHYCMSTDCQG